MFNSGPINSVLQKNFFTWSHSMHFLELVKYLNEKKVFKMSLLEINSRSYCAQQSFCAIFK